MQVRQIRYNTPVEFAIQVLEQTQSDAPNAVAGSVADTVEYVAACKQQVRHSSVRDG